LKSATTVLLIDDDPAGSKLTQEALAAIADGHFGVALVTCFADAIEWLNRERAEVILLGMAFPDEHGVDAFGQVLHAAPDSLILVLDGGSDEGATRQTVQGDTCDYLAQAHVDVRWLPSLLRHVVGRKNTHDTLRNSEERFRAICDASPLGIFVSDSQDSCIYTNAAYHEIAGLTREQILGSNWSSAIHPEDRQQVLREWRDATAGQASFHAEVRFLRTDGSIVWVRLNVAAMPDTTTSYSHVQTVENITARKTIEFQLQMSEDALFEEKERAEVTLNSIGDAVLSTDLQCNVSYMNMVAEAMTGWGYKEALGRPLTEVFQIIDGVTRQAVDSPAQRAIAENRTVGLTSDCVLVRRDGFESPIEDSTAPIHGRDGRAVGAVIVFHDVSASRSMAQKMFHLAQHDFLTGLPNRVLLAERLSQAIRLANRHHKQVALLFLDIDYFKHINDSLGHAVGDRLLQSVGERLKACMRATDTVCRQGGDEFVVLLGEIDQPQDAAHVAETLRARLSLPHAIGGHELHVTLSMGISVYPDDGSEVDVLMQNADTAMYHAKAGGRNSYQFFTADMNIRAVQRLFVESSLRRALKQKEFVLHYQPKIDLGSGLMIGAEALIRWQDPHLGLIPPEQFVPMAEECGLIVPIGRWVIREACRQIQAWIEAGLHVVPVSVNISAVEFRREDFLADVALILKETGVAPRYLELELTESILMQDTESSASVLVAIKAMGMHLAIDDFGTGYSSLSYLKRFPIDALKIDQSFVRDITTNADDATIVNAVIGMGKNLKQRVIAEGVETAEQLALLQLQQCDEGQGFLFSPPLGADDFAEWLTADRCKIPLCFPLR
jgi:diguanylate cyclase (GGDEF)-like protein/PAS domain S-box-containing protein